MSQNRFSLSNRLSNQKTVVERRIGLNKLSLERFPFPTVVNLRFLDIAVSGATEVISGSYKIATFNSSGTLQINRLGTDPTEGNIIEYLVVAGGGGGGCGQGTTTGTSGGGAGGMGIGTRTVSDSSPANFYTVTVGGGGSGGTDTTNGTKGSTSRLTYTAFIPPFDTPTLVGVIREGGGGAVWAGYDSAVQDGGSGAGSSYPSITSVGLGTPGQGNNGGRHQGVNDGGGGGGGAGAVGTNASGENGGNGGIGSPSSITGVSMLYAGGGGGSSSASPGPQIGGAGGLGGGGNGGSNDVSAATDGGGNMGGGGGGECGDGSSARTVPARGGNGGSGIIVVKWRFRA